MENKLTKNEEQEITAEEFFELLNSIPSYTAKNIKVKLKDGFVSIGEISITTIKK